MCASRMAFVDSFQSVVSVPSSLIMLFIVVSSLIAHGNLFPTILLESSPLSFRSSFYDVLFRYFISMVASHSFVMLLLLSVFSSCSLKFILSPADRFPKLSESDILPWYRIFHRFFLPHSLFRRFLYQIHPPIGLFFSC